MERDLDALSGRTHNLRLVKLLLPVAHVFDALVPLHNADHHKRHLRQRKVLSDADAWAAVERDEVPWFGLPDLPALWREDVRMGEIFGGGRVEVFAALHGEGGVDDAVPLDDGEWEIAIGPATGREGGVCECEAEVEWDCWVKPETFVDGVLQVLHVLQIFVSRGSCRAHGVEDFFSQFGPNLRVVRHLIEDPGERGCCGVSSCQQDRYNLVPDHHGILCEARKGMQEGKSLFGFIQLLELTDRETECLMHEGVYEVVDDFDRTVILSPRDKELQGPIRQ